MVFLLPEAELVVEEIAPEAGGLVATEYMDANAVADEYLPWFTAQRAGALVKTMFVTVAGALGWLAATVGLTHHTPAPQPPRPAPGRTAPLITAVGPDTPTVPAGPLTGVLQVLRETIVAMQQVITRHVAALSRVIWEVEHWAIPKAIRAFDILSVAPGYRMAKDIATVAPRLGRKARLAGMPDAASPFDLIGRDFPVTLAGVLPVALAAVQGITRVVDDCVITDCQEKQGLGQARKALDDRLGDLAGLGFSLAGLGLMKWGFRDPEGAARWMVDHGFRVIGEGCLAGAAAATATGAFDAVAEYAILADVFLDRGKFITDVVDILADP